MKSIGYPLDTHHERTIYLKIMGFFCEQVRNKKGQVCSQIFVCTGCEVEIGIEVFIFWPLLFRGLGFRGFP